MNDEQNADASERHLNGLVVCVQSRDGWCATKRRKSMEYSDNVPTLCGMVVTLPFGIERREPDCPDCLAKIRMSAHTDNERVEAAVDVPRLVRDYDSLSFQEQCKVAKNAEIGSEWIHKKSGRSAFVSGHSLRGVLLKRPGGRDTIKQHHYFAYDYFPANGKLTGQI